MPFLVTKSNLKKKIFLKSVNKISISNPIFTRQKINQQNNNEI